MKKILLTLFLIGIFAILFGRQFQSRLPLSAKTITATAAETVALWGTRGADFVYLYTKIDTNADLADTNASLKMAWQFSPDNSHWLTGGVIHDSINQHDTLGARTVAYKDTMSCNAGYYPYLRIVYTGIRANNQAKVTFQYSTLK